TNHHDAFMVTASGQSRWPARELQRSFDRPLKRTHSPDVMTPATLSQRTVILLTPLALVGLQLTHPSNVVDTTPGWWTTLHLLQMPLFGLMALAVVWLVGSRMVGLLGQSA